MGFFKDGIRAKLQKVAEQANKDYAVLLAKWGDALAQFNTFAILAAQQEAQLAALMEAYPGGGRQFALDCIDVDDRYRRDAATARAFEAIQIAHMNLGATLDDMRILFRNAPSGVAGIKAELNALEKKEETALTALNTYAEEKATKQKALSSSEYKAWKAQYTAILNALK